MNMEKEIKTETNETLNDELEDYGTYGTASTVHIPPDHPDLQTHNIGEVFAQQHNMLVEKKLSTSSSNGNGGAAHFQNGGHGSNLSSTGPMMGSEIKPTWFPSAKGRSIVWEHITWVPETQRAACNYCNADFQIKGGTSALLRHLKTIHPAAINFDPENPPPVVRRKRKKIEEDYTVVTDETRSYVDNLLEQFMHNDQQLDLSDDNLTPRHQNMVDPSEMHMRPHSQNRADSEIDEVIRTLQQENGGEQAEPDDLRRLLGIDDDLMAREEVIAGRSVPYDDSMELHDQLLAPSTVSVRVTSMAPLNPDEEKQMPSSSSAPPRKRKGDEPKAVDVGELGVPDSFKHGKYSLSLMSAARRPTPQAIGHQPVGAPPANLPGALAHNLAPPTSSTVAASAAAPTKYNAQAIQCLDFEAKVLYNQSLKATVLREEAMGRYYQMKSRKVELEIKKLERELGESSQTMSPEERDE